MQNDIQPRTLREALRMRRMHAYELAERIGVTPNAVSRWENNRTVPQPPTRNLMSLVLEVPKDVVDSWFSRAAA